MEKGRKMTDERTCASPRALKNFLGLSIALGYNYSWIRDRLLINHYIMQNFDDFLTVFCKKSGLSFRKDQKEFFLAMLRAESVSLVVKYAEDLASLSIAFSRNQVALQDTLKTYRVRDIKKFYKSINGKSQEYFRRVLGYPIVEDIDDPTEAKQVRNSQMNAKEAFNDIASFYVKHDDFYNSYKHGLRIIPCTSAEGWDIGKLEKGGITEVLYFSNQANDLQFETLDSEVYEKSLDLAGKIFRLLTVMFENHRQWFFGKGEKYECSLF